MDGPPVVAQLRRSLGPRLDRWRVEASKDQSGQWEIALTHPASAGLTIQTVTFDNDKAIAFAASVLATCVEIDIAAAAPDLQHADLIAGFRTIAHMFEWDTREVRAVAFLMFEHGHLTHDEAAWLSGYEGADAPMKAMSPFG